MELLLSKMKNIWDKRNDSIVFSKSGFEIAFYNSYSKIITSPTIFAKLLVRKKIISKKFFFKIDILKTDMINIKR